MLLDGGMESRTVHGPHHHLHHVISRERVAPGRVPVSRDITKKPLRVPMVEEGPVREKVVRQTAQPRVFQSFLVRHGEGRRQAGV
jgi:hypothetical protein